MTKFLIVGIISFLITNSFSSESEFGKSPLSPLDTKENELTGGLQKLMDDLQIKDDELTAKVNGSGGSYVDTSSDDSETPTDFYTPYTPTSRGSDYGSVQSSSELTDIPEPPNYSYPDSTSDVVDDPDSFLYGFKNNIPVLKKNYSKNNTDKTAGE